MLWLVSLSSPLSTSSWAPLPGPILAGGLQLHTGVNQQGLKIIVLRAFQRSLGPLETESLPQIQRTGSDAGISNFGWGWGSGLREPMAELAGPRAHRDANRCRGGGQVSKRCGVEANLH